MCLVVPGKIIRIEGDRAVVDYGVEQRAGKLLEEGYSEGDYVMLQGGLVVQKIPEEEAQAALKLYVESLK